MSETQEPIMPPERKGRSFVQNALTKTRKFLFPLSGELPKVLPRTLGPENESFLTKTRKTVATVGTLGDIARYALAAKIANDLAMSGKQGAAVAAVAILGLGPSIIKSRVIRGAATEAITTVRGIVRR